MKPKKELMAELHRRHAEAGRKKRGYYLTDDENEQVKKFIEKMKKNVDGKI